MKRPVLFTIALVMTLASQPSAHAKDVSITWKAIKRAASYELRVEHAGRTERSEKAKNARWSGDLPFGLYGYQIRAIDKIGRPGKWSTLKPLAVMPESPDLKQPKNGASLVYYDPKRSPKLSWEKVEGVSRYEVEVLRGGGIVFHRETTASEVEIPAQAGGVYSWRVMPVMDPGSMNAFRGKKWKGKAGERRDFKLEYRKLQAPVVIYPVGPVVRNQGLDLDFRWKEVEGAEAYEVRYAPAPRGRKPAASEFRRLVTKDPSVSARQIPDGTWVWEVKALASYDASRKIASIDGAETRADFQLETSGTHPDGTGYVAFSGMFAPYTYFISSPQASAARAAAANSFVARVSGEYWPQAKFGGSLAVNQGFMSITSAPATSTGTSNENNLSRTDIELYGKTQLIFGNLFVQPKLGLLRHDYLRILPTGSGKVGTMGMGMGFDARYAFSARWSLGLKFEYFIPRTLSLEGVTGTLYGHDSYRNTSVGLQAIYWLGPRWGMGMGAFIEQRSLSYELSTGGVEDIQMDAKYFFGSLIYSWGR